ncbi:MAG: hypothetical protein AAF206_24395 [Bacteroidota bacterium]
MQSSTPACPCPSKEKQVAKKSASSLLPAFIVALVPKCQLCLLAYGSAAATLCTNPIDSPLFLNAWAAWLSIAFGLMSFGLVIYNFRGQRSFVAGGMILVGIAFICLAAFYSLSEMDFYTGVILMFSGVWVNASFVYFFRNWLQPFVKAQFSR